MEFLLIRFVYVAAIVVLVGAVVLVAVLVLRRTGKLASARRVVEPVVREHLATKDGMMGTAGRAAARYLDGGETTQK